MKGPNVDVDGLAAVAGRNHGGRRRARLRPLRRSLGLRLIERLGVVSLSVAIVAAACTSSGTLPTTGAQLVTSTTLSEAATTAPPNHTSTTQTPTTTTAPLAETTNTAPLFEYAVVAEERARRLAIIDPASPCLSDGGTCNLAPILTVELSERPHNLTGVGSVVYATHPAAGSISRVDIAAGDILTAAVGTEPHDIEYDPRVGALYVTDETGRRLLVVDSETLDVIDVVHLPAEPHDLAVADDAIWVTLIGRNELARVSDNQVDLFPTGGSPHDLIVDPNGLIWFSNWGSHVLGVLDSATGTTAEAPAGVAQPHHFAIAPDGVVWLSDNGAAAIVGFTAQPVTVDVGPTPHHLEFVGDTIIVAVSGAGEAVLIRDGHVVARSQLTPGLHGVAAVELTRPLDIADR